MSVTQSQKTKRNATARRTDMFQRAIEQLEDRTLMSATLTLVNPDTLPGSNRLIFNYIQNPDTTVPNAVHDQQVLEITDTGTTPLIISSMTLSGPWSFVGAPVGGYSNVTVNPGTPLNVTLEFTQRSLPAHTTNETNYTSEPNGGAYIDGSLSIISNDATNPTQTVALTGYWQNQSADEEEPNLSTIINGLAGYDTVTATASQLSSESNGVDLQNNGTTPTYYGQEVVSSAWQAANALEPVSIQALAEYYIEGVTDTTYWYNASTLSSHPLLTAADNQGQTVLPTNSSGQLLQASFVPNGTFGFRDDNLYSNDSINTTNGDTVDDGHRFRFYPLIDSNGNAVANTWIVAVHEGTSLADYQDAVYIVSNMEPAAVSTTPPAPTNLTATSAAQPVLSWTGVDYTDLAGYNVYRSTTSTGTYTKLTSSPISTTTYTDTAAAAGTTYYYRVTAVDSTSGNESAPATTNAVTPGGSISTNGGPVAGSFSVSAFSNEAVAINVLANVTDTTGTPTASSLMITTSPTHGTATVNTADGVISYTSNSGFTGPETIIYSISDSNGAAASSGTITINVVNPATTAPITSPQFGTTLANTAVVLTPIALDNTGATITPALVEVATTSTTFTTTVPETLSTSGGGTITLNSDFTVTYTPAANFVGSDSFQFKVQDSHGNLSTTATYTINVGVQIASTRGANKSVLYPDTGGQMVTASLSRGVADIYYAGSGTESAAKGKVTVTGSHLTISGIVASQTTAASSLVLTTHRNGGSITVSGITDTGTLGTIIARSTNLTGVTGTPTIVLGGVRAIYLESINSAEIQLGGTGVNSVSLIAGTVTNSFLSSAVTVNSLNVKSWSNSTSSLTAESVTAPVIRSLVVAGEFDPDLDLTGTGRDLYGATIRGIANKGLWTLDGSAGPIFISSVGSAWGGINATGTLTSVRVNSGLPAGISAGAINSLSVAGTLSGDITTTGNLHALRAAQLTGSTINVGSSANSLIAPSTSTIGTATLGSLVLTSRAAGTFSDSDIVADVIDSVYTGPINTAGTGEGIAATTIRSLTLNTGSGNVRIPAKDLASNSALTNYLSSKNVSLGNFTIDIV